MATTTFARDVEWRRPEIANQNQPRAFAAPKAKPIVRQAAVQRAGPSNTKALAVRRKSVSKVVPVSREIELTVSGPELGLNEPALAPIPTAQSSVYTSTPVQPGYFSPVRPWHPHQAYAAPLGARVARRFEPLPGGPEEIAPQESVLSPSMNIEEGFAGDCCADCGAAGYGRGPWTARCPQCDPGFLSGVMYASVAAGVEGFKGPTDLGINGNFGFSETINFSGPTLCGRLGYQVGARFVQSNFNGDQTTGVFRSDDRAQTFFTAALFRRSTDCCPWQYGVAFDTMRDHYYYKADLSQLRIEVSRR
ncbi:MAG: hypothetical protein N2C12_09030, partial [Planctomycetales bacterium]